MTAWVCMSSPSDAVEDTAYTVALKLGRREW